MNFIIKCSLQKIFSIVPFGVELNYICQKILKHQPATYDEYIGKANEVAWHYSKYNANRMCSIEDSIYYEFGAGWDLVSPLLMKTYGFKRIIVSDIRKQIFPLLLNNTSVHMKAYLSEKNILEDNGSYGGGGRRRKYTFVNSVDLLKMNGVEYIAPLDTQRTGFQSQSIDFICTNATLEHIPYPVLKNIIQECYRILKPGGIMTHKIDYRDHWAYVDKSISAYNYLKYSDKEWEKYNPSIHYQNRLRNSDYRKIF